MKDVLDKMRVEATNGKPLSLEQQRKLIKKFGLGEFTDADRAALAAAEAKRARKAAQRKDKE